MGGPVLAGWLLANKLFKDYQAQVIRILKKPRPFATSTDDATLLLSQYDTNGLLAPARSLLATHIANHNNPHQDSMDTINSYSASTITAKMAAKVPNSVLPISTYGIKDDLTDAQVLASWSGSGFVLTCNRAMNVVLSGTPYKIPVSSIDLSAVTPSPANKTFYLYVRLQFGRVSYQARTDAPPESVSVMFIGTITTGAAGITGITAATVTRVDTYRLSLLPLGSVIPVESGTYDAPGKFPTSWNPT